MTAAPAGRRDRPPTGTAIPQEGPGCPDRPDGMGHRRSGGPRGFPGPDRGGVG